MSSRSQESEPFALRQELYALNQQRRELIAQANTAKATLETIRQNHLPQINTLSSRADALAVQFKEKYEESTEAFVDGDGELAKEFSLEGHELQEKCESLNQLTSSLRSAMRSELNTQIEVMKGKLREANTLQKRIDDLSKKLRSANAAAGATVSSGAPSRELASHITLADFTKNDVGIVRSFLSKFPVWILKKIERIAYLSEEVKGQRGALIAGRTQKNSSGKYVIQIMPYDVDLGDDLFNTIAHELAHIAFDGLPIPTKQEWEALYSNTNDSQFVFRYAMRSAEEDFSESMATFYAKPQALAKLHPQKYAFLEEINK